MERPYILHMLSPLKHVSPFDANMALDAGFNAVLPYTGVEAGEVAGLVQDAIFSRGPSSIDSASRPTKSPLSIETNLSRPHSFG